MNLTVGDRVRFKDVPGSWRPAGSPGTVVRATARTSRPGKGLMYIVHWDNGDTGHTWAADLERVDE